MNPATNKANRDLLRKQYLNNLLLEAKNNEINYQANKILQITGEEPVRPPDTSSIEDKFKNVLNLQTLVRSQLMELTDGTNANQIVDGLSDDMLQFVTQRMPSLVEELKPKYALGIPAQVFLQYVIKLKLKAEATLDNEYGSSGQTPFSSAVTTPELDFNDIYEQPTMGFITPPSTPTILSKEFKTANEKAPEPRAVDWENEKLKDIKERLLALGHNTVTGNNGSQIPVNVLTKNGKSPHKQLKNTNAFQLLAGTSGSGIRGRGLKTKASRIKVDTNGAGIIKQHRYIPFGRYVINRHQLNNKDIFMIKTMKGGTISDLPTVKVSNSLSNVLQKMIGGKVPTFDDLNDLSADDKNHLHHITKKCDINVSVPTPNKDKLQQEMNKFDILKGEILAGNDNKEMVKEFKVMLLRFMNENRIPRRQGQEILTDLVAMGY